jgi:hypothetical protein
MDGISGRRQRQGGGRGGGGRSGGVLWSMLRFERDVREAS